MFNYNEKIYPIETKHQQQLSDRILIHLQVKSIP